MPWPDAWTFSFLKDWTSGQDIDFLSFLAFEILNHIMQEIIPCFWM